MDVMPRMGDLAALDNAFDVPGEQTYDRRLDQTWPGRLAQDAMGAVLAPGLALQSTEPITTEQMIKPAADLAGLVTGGSYAKPAMKDASGMGIRAYHGQPKIQTIEHAPAGIDAFPPPSIKAYHSSPHDVDKFDLAKIGTGEGAQMYGHGLYFAENPAVSGRGGQYWNQFLHRFEGTPEGHAAGRLRAEGWDRDKAIAATQRDVNDWMDPKAFPDRKYAEKMLALRQAELDALVSGKPVGPRTYEVEIAADPAHMLDWDKPLHGQAGRDALLDVSRRMSNRDPTALDMYNFLARGTEGSPVSGRDYYQALAGLRGRASPELSQALSEAGVPGIKYLDQGSRAASSTNIAQTEAAITAVRDKIQKLDPKRDQDLINFHMNNMARWEAEVAHAKANPPTSNYVIFDPEIVRIMKKYGIAGAAPAGMGALAAQDNYQQ